MSIEAEILRIQRNIADTYAVVAEKGGSVPLDPSSANLAGAVRSLPSSGGGDGSPVGTVVSYMGKTAPSGYLICDGAVKNISDYPTLAQHFKTQFGSINYFGGNGTTTFAVPDMRNLFLRGYHGSAASLSGEVGKKQEATVSPYRYASSTSCNFAAKESSGRNSIENQDSLVSGGYGVWYTGDYDGSTRPGYSGYTARPVNMAVLYCIKAE